MLGRTLDHSRIESKLGQTDTSAVTAAMGLGRVVAGCGILRLAGVARN